MKGVVFLGNRKLELRDFPDPAPGPGEGVEAAMDCTGNPDARVAAVWSAATWGRVRFGGEGNTTTFDVSQECARFIAGRKIPLARLLTHRFRLEQADEAYRLFDTQTTGKGVFVS